MPPDSDLARLAIGEAINIHRALGPGLFESAYEEILYRRLRKHGVAVERQLLVPFVYDGDAINFGFRVDLLLDRALVIELKCVERPSPIHQRQLLTYLRLMDLPFGLLINFGLDTLLAGLDRVVNYSCSRQSV
ncbi:GxxExxY protein [Gemmatimonas sp.]|jgi:GxxExxY protein|uniref:GxxExxY protein n=1 Tax=Gemmatimonas sp. TaxID=1962908 RepID=UPI0031CA6ACD|nr:GxxExxY protein [Gemmatimonas sp.]